jgi:hypothetical protein
MKRNLTVLLCCLSICGTLAFAQTTATVVSIDKQSSDARHPEKGDQYKIAMRIGNTIYMCHASGPASNFLDWSPGKEFPAQLSDKVMQVAGPNGTVVELNIAGKKAAK